MRQEPNVQPIPKFDGSGVIDDKFWAEAADFVRRIGTPGNSIVAPSGFDELVPCLNYDQRDECASPKVIVLHKGQLETLGLDWIEAATKSLHPSFANEVFVVFTEKKPMRSIITSPHFVALKQRLAAMARRMEARPAATDVHMAARPAAAGSRMAVFLGDHLALTKTIYGHKIYVDTRDFSLAPHILMDGYWEQWITNVFRQLMRPGMQVLDIGANIGWYSLLAADLIGPTGRLTSFEANPVMAEIVYRNLMVNGFLDRAKVEAKAVYSESKVLEFQVYEHYMGSSSLFATSESAASFKDTLKTLQVDAVSLDDFLPAGSKIDFIKVDAEGAEPYILKGGARLLSENRHVQIMMEFAPSLIASSYGSIELFYREIAALGFSIWRIGHDSRLVKSSLDDLSSVAHCDVILRR